MSLQHGTRLGPYTIDAAIGAGRMGEVYKALDTKLDRDVALKILPDASPERYVAYLVILAFSCCGGSPTTPSPQVIVQPDQGIYGSLP